MNEDTAWMLSASCRDTHPGLWFPPRGASVTEAKAICRTCPVRHACLDYALATSQHHGIWGGLSNRERRRLRRHRNAA